MVQVQITPIPTPRSSPAPSPAPTEHEHSNPREEPSLDAEEHKLLVVKNCVETNREHIQNNELPPVNVIDKSAGIFNGFITQSKPKNDKTSLSDKEVLEMNENPHQPINR